MAIRRKLTAAELRKKAFDFRAKSYIAHNKYEETLIFEQLSEKQKFEINSMLVSYQKTYGPVKFHNWLRAVVRCMRGNFENMGRVLIFELLPRTSKPELKKQFLEVMAKQMQIDVTITINKKPKFKTTSLQASELKR